LADCLPCALSALKAAGYRHVAKGLVGSNGAVLSLRVAVGPSATDQSSATLITSRWEDLGILVTQVNETSDTAAAAAAASNHVDAAVFTRPTMTTPSYAARSWAGPAYVDSYPSGERTSQVTSLYDTAVANFNPVAANATWLSLDQVIMNEFWVRPLYTAPSLVEWSSTLANVVGSLSVTGFVDQLSSWTIAPPSPPT
jgi:ABC-type transport system substrate-binding protein